MAIDTLAVVKHSPSDKVRSIVFGFLALAESADVPMIGFVLPMAKPLLEVKLKQLSDDDATAALTGLSRVAAACLDDTVSAEQIAELIASLVPNAS